MLQNCPYLCTDHTVRQQQRIAFKLFLASGALALSTMRGDRYIPFSGHPFILDIYLKAEEFGHSCRSNIFGSCQAKKDLDPTSYFWPESQSPPHR